MRPRSIVPGLRPVPCTPHGGALPSDHCSSITVTAIAMRWPFGQAKAPFCMCVFLFTRVSQRSHLFNSEGSAGSSRFYSRFTDDPAGLVIFRFEERGKLRATDAGGEQALGRELRLDLWRHGSRREPIGQPS